MWNGHFISVFYHACAAKFSFAIQACHGINRLYFLANLITGLHHQHTKLYYKINNSNYNILWSITICALINTIIQTWLECNITPFAFIQCCESEQMMTAFFIFVWTIRLTVQKNRMLIKGFRGTYCSIGRMNHFRLRCSSRQS